MTGRISTSFVLTLVFSATAVAEPEWQEAVEFTRVKGTSAAAGVFTTFPTTERRIRLEERTKTLVVEGREVQQTFTVAVPFTVPVVRTLTKKSHDAFDGDGQPIPSESVFERLENGQIVFISKTSTVPPEWLRLLSPEAVILAPKPADETEVPGRPGS